MDGGPRHVPLLTIPGAAERTVTLHAPSKTYNVAGLCAAFAVIPDPALRQRFKRASAGILADTNLFGERATLTLSLTLALTLPASSQTRTSSVSASL